MGTFSNSYSISECEPRNLLKDLPSLPDWDQCWTMKDGSKPCGEGIEYPYAAYLEKYSASVVS